MYRQFDESSLLQVGGFRIIKWGKDNDYPAMIREKILETGVVSTVVSNHINLIWGAGPRLYVSGFENGRKQKIWRENPMVEDWLESWDYKTYLEKSLTEFFFLNCIFSKIYFENMKVLKLEVVDSNTARFEYRDRSSYRDFIIVGPDKNGSYQRFYAYDRIYLYNNEEAISFDAIPQMGDPVYPNSPIHGSLSWINLKKNSSIVLSNHSSTAIQPRYHIEIPEWYISTLRNTLQVQYLSEGKVFSESVLERAIDERIEDLSSVLSGVDNAGKFLVTDYLFDERAERYLGWIIHPIEGKSKEYVSGQLKIGHESSFQISAGMGMHPSLTGLQKKGGLPTGSEMMVAAKLYKHVQTEMAITTVTRMLNEAIRINFFPDTMIKVGFDNGQI